MRILLIEDESDFANGLAKALHRQGYATDIAEDAERGIQLAEISSYDLIILDLNLPGLDGLEVCQRLRSKYPHLLILILTARSQITDTITGLDMGADDYVSKPVSFEGLFARIRALFRRDFRGRSPILQCGDLKLDPASKTIWQGNRRLEFTRKEFAILEYMMRRPREVVSQEEIIEHVWDNQTDTFSKSVRVYVTSLRKKLGDDPESPRYIETLRGQGYRLISSVSEGDS
ncbi:MAG: response regulator transcription factor [Desulfuromonadaceae bacterium]|nr:response regulator transcription factor [Desulfuromonadaceae bacterium]